MTYVYNLALHLRVMGGGRLAANKQTAGAPDSPPQAQTDFGHPQTARTNRLRAPPDAKHHRQACHEKKIIFTYILYSTLYIA